MQSNAGFTEIVVFLVYWGLFAIIAEAIIELLLTAGPLEQIRAYLARKSSIIASLLSCGYCFSVWICFAIAWILPSPMDLAGSFGISNNYTTFVNVYLWWFVNGILLHRLSNVVHNKITNNMEIEVVE